MNKINIISNDGKQVLICADQSLIFKATRALVLQHPEMAEEVDLFLKSITESNNELHEIKHTILDEECIRRR